MVATFLQTAAGLTKFEVLCREAWHAAVQKNWLPEASKGRFVASSMSFGMCSVRMSQWKLWIFLGVMMLKQSNFQGGQSHAVSISILGGGMPCHTYRLPKILFGFVSDSSTACGWCCCPSHTPVLHRGRPHLCAKLPIRRLLNFRDGHCIWRVFHWREGAAWQIQHPALSSIIHHPAQSSLDLARFQPRFVKDLPFLYVRHTDKVLRKQKLSQVSQVLYGLFKPTS